MKLASLIAAAVAIACGLTAAVKGPALADFSTDHEGQVLSDTPVTSCVVDAITGLVNRPSERAKIVHFPNLNTKAEVFEYLDRSWAYVTIKDANGDISGWILRKALKCTR